MKIRSGFVSNSSSASFIIGEEHEPLLKQALLATGKSLTFATPYQVAVEMLKASDRKETLKKLKSYKKKDYDSICFPSINEDTQIYAVDGTVYVEACNNESFSWDVAMEQIHTKYNVKVTPMYESADFPKQPDYSSDKVLVITDYEHGSE